MKRPALLAVLAIGAIACGGLPLGCARSERASEARANAEGREIDAPTMAFLSIARALHHEADIEEGRGDVPAALAAIERLVTTPAPKGAEADEVLADAYARLAELRLKQSDLQGAASEVARGLEHARDPTYFRGHLLEVEGLIEEARAGALADAGKTGEAQRATARAMGLLEQAVRVQEHVIERALADGGRHE